MDTPVIMPQLGNEIEEALITSVLKQVGDAVTAGEALLAVTTPKVTLEIEAPTSGTVSKIQCENGQAVEYGQPLFLID